VLDSGSQDRTLDIAKRLGARTLQEAWRGYAKQKIRATALARHDWVLSLDADEALGETAQQEILRLFAAGESGVTADAYSFPRLAYYLGRWMRHGGMYPDRQTRLYHRGRAKWTETQVHEHIEANKVEKLNCDILHWSFSDIAHQIETVNRYSSLRAQDFRNQKKSFSAFKMIFKSATKFFEAYFVKGGYRDGRPGLVAAGVTAFSTFLRWAKLYEIELDQAKRPIPQPSSHIGSKN
jgi:glycosyltransferase involved in cell wall biosynthesis